MAKSSSTRNRTFQSTILILRSQQFTEFIISIHCLSIIHLHFSLHHADRTDSQDAERIQWQSFSSHALYNHGTRSILDCKVSPLILVGNPVARSLLPFIILSITYLLKSCVSHLISLCHSGMLQMAPLLPKHYPS